MKDTLEIGGKTYEKTSRITDRYGMMPSTISRLVQQHKLPAPLKIGRMSYFCVEDIDKMLLATAE
jgi:predicted DNA-binding transcriptional regulator AlpA